MNWTDGEIDGVVVRDLKPHADARGWLLELFRSDEVAPEILPAMSYVSMTRPGVARGPHEHVEQTDYFAFVGPGTFRLLLWDNRSASPTCGRRMRVEGGTGRPIAIVVPPGVVHGYLNIGTGEGWVLNYPNRLYAGPGRKERVDEVRHEDRPDSPFRME